MIGIIIITVLALIFGIILVNLDKSFQKDSVEIEVYKTSLIVNIIAWIIVIVMFVGIIFVPVILIIWIVKKIKRCKKIE